MDKNQASNLEWLRSALCQSFGWQLPDNVDSLDLELPDGLPVSISLSPDGRDLVFYSVLQDMVAPSQVVLMATALILNLHQEATRGGAIGLDAQGGALVYSWRLPAHAELEQVLGGLDGFCATAQELAAKLQTELQEWPPQDLQRLERAAAGLSDPGEVEGESLDPAANQTDVIMLKV